MIKVIGDRVLVALRPEPDEVKTAAGLVLARDPDLIRTPTQGIVMQLGEKSRTVSLDAVLVALEDVATGYRTGHLNDGPEWGEIVGAVEALKPPAFDVHVGDCVLFTRFVGEEISDGDVTYLILRESEIIGIVTAESEAA